MKHYKYGILLLLGFACFACQQEKSSKPAHLRILSMIQYTPVKLNIHGKGKNNGIHKTLSLGYGEPSDYQQLSPGYYDITLSVQGKKLLKKTYVMGKKGYYTLLATGLLPQKWKVNPQTTVYKLKYIFAGEELQSANRYLPQWKMMRDNYDGSKKSAYIRLVNANPHTTKLSVKKDGKALKSGLAYPIESDMLKIKPGSHNVRVLYGKVHVAEKNLRARPGYIYTAILGNGKSGEHKLTISMLQNPSRTLMQMKQNK